MATILYKCNICKRTIELLENSNGMTVFSKCIITSGCRGKLHQETRNSNNIRENYPNVVPGFTNYSKRNILFEFEQKLLNNTWKINHNLNTFPSVNVYTQETSGIIKQNPDSFEIKYINPNTIHIVFSTIKKGKIQCVSRTSSDKTTNKATKVPSFVQVTHGGTFNFAVPKYLTEYNSIVRNNRLDLDEYTVEVEVSIQKPNE